MLQEQGIADGLDKSKGSVKSRRKGRKERKSCWRVNCALTRFEKKDRTKTESTTILVAITCTGGKYHFGCAPIGRGAPNEG
jgi:hypothetical protein